MQSHPLRSGGCECGRVTDHCPQNYITSCRDGTYTDGTYRDGTYRDGTCRDGTYRLWGEVKIGEGVQPDKELLHQFFNFSVPLVFLVLLHCLHMQR